MLFREILEFVVVQIAAQPDGGQHRNVPVIKALSPTITARVLIDILRNKTENLVAHLRLAIDVLQAVQDGNDFVATLQIELDFRNGLTIQPPLT
jgi:hypothetical protein